MKFINSLFHFFANGVGVFREASRGEYNRESDAVTKFKSDLFSEQVINDKARLLQDREAIEKDVRKVWNKILLSHG